MVGAAAAKAALAGLKTEKYVFERTAYPELYHMATPEMAAHNAERCDSQVSAGRFAPSPVTKKPPGTKESVFLSLARDSASSWLGRLTTGSGPAVQARMGGKCTRSHQTNVTG